MRSADRPLTPTHVALCATCQSVPFSDHLEGLLATGGRGVNLARAEPRGCEDSHLLSGSASGHSRTVRERGVRVKSSDLAEVRRTLWKAADELRANSRLRSHEYSGPVLGLIFLKYADDRLAPNEFGG